jgi:hypothetical protein
MFGLAAVLFFSATGLTLNHPDWFGESQRRVTAQGQLNPKWLHVDVPAAASVGEPDESRSVAKLEVVEHLRKTHGIRGALAEFRVDDQECDVTFKGPGYAADAFINRATGKYDLTQTMHGFVAVMNDLHKGRDAGRAWSVLIDASAVVLILISVSGVGLLLYIKRKRVPGLAAAVVGTLVVIAVVLLLVP